ncbi:MAG: patatin-like phospholipase family protein [Chloroflexota bacterium]
MLFQSGTKVGYALGGGGARGLSHIGVLKVLNERGILPDIIAGTSMGAVIGALYAGGMEAGDIEHLIVQLDWRRLVLLADLTLPVRGLIQGRRVFSLLKSILGDLTFPQLRCDFVCVATDILTGEQVVLHDGSLIEAVWASIAIPGIFTPVKIDGRYLVDGGLVNEVPVSVCRQRGAGWVVGVNVIPEPSKMVLGSRKGHSDYRGETSKARETGNKSKSPTVSSTHSPHLRLRFNNIEQEIKTFLMSHRPKEEHRMLRLLDSMPVNNSKRLPSRAPTLLDVLSQSLTIAEYRIAMENLKDVDLAISPDVAGIGFWQFDKAAEAITAGEVAVRQSLQQSK